MAVAVALAAENSSSGPVGTAPEQAVITRLRMINKGYDGRMIFLYKAEIRLNVD